VLPLLRTQFRFFALFLSLGETVVNRIFSYLFDAFVQRQAQLFIVFPLPPGTEGAGPEQAALIPVAEATHGAVVLARNYFALLVGDVGNSFEEVEFLQHSGHVIFVPDYFYYHAEDYTYYAPEPTNQTSSKKDVRSLSLDYGILIIAHENDAQIGLTTNAVVVTFTVSGKSDMIIEFFFVLTELEGIFFPFEFERLDGKKYAFGDGARA
jgi:hypothetical protein